MPSTNPPASEIGEIEAPSPLDDHHAVDEDEAHSDNSSVVEVQDEEIPGYFTEINDRLYHSHPTSPYPLPVDTPEIERLTVNHKVLKRLLGSNYFGPADATLAVNPTPRVLDMCTGNGKWVLEMVEQFPHAQFIGIDIVPIATRYPPPGVQFELWDINSTLRWEGSHFDLVHARDILMGTSDYRLVLNEVARVLRPDGLFLAVEWSSHVDFDPSFPGFYVEDHAPASIRFSETVRRILSDSFLVQPDGADVSTMISDSIHFSNVVTEQIYVPIGTWPQDEDMSRLGSSFRAGHKKMAGGFKQMFVDSGMPPQEADAIIGEYIEEIQHVDGLVVIAHATYARRV